jgi:subtilisin family serine protease
VEPGQEAEAAGAGPRVAAVTEVLRRFEIQAPSPKARDDIHGKLLKLVAKASGPVTPEVSRVEQPPLLDVRLEGGSTAVSGVMTLIVQLPGARIRHDSLDVPSARKGSVYPDLGTLLRIDAEPGTKAPPRGPVNVAIVDSGITVDHPELRNHLWTGDGGIHGKRFIEGKSDADVTDEDGHGTMLAGTILAVANPAPGVRLMAAKFFDGTTLPRPGNAASAIDFAVENGAGIICLSWDVGLGSARLEEAIRNACRSALVVIAAGNNGSDNDRLPSFPSCYRKECPDRIITVMATNRYDEKAGLSNYGRKSVDLAAPGVAIVSTRRLLSKVAKAAKPELGWYRSYTGTSAAAAHVTGAAALLKASYSDLSPEHIKRCLVESVDRLGLKCVSGGRLNLGKALHSAAALMGAQPGNPARRRSRARRSRRSGSRIA